MKTNLTITAFLGLITIILGAFGAHALKEHLSPESLQSYETGVRYMMYHVLALLFVNTCSGFTPKNIKVISLFFYLGIFCFSGSIFAITAGGIPAKSIWFITPLGGLLLMAGWLSMAIFFMSNKTVTR